MKEPEDSRLLKPHVAWLVDAHGAVELLLLLGFLFGEAHASRVIPLLALIAFDIEEVRIEGLHARAEGLP